MAIFKGRKGTKKARPAVRRRPVTGRLSKKSGHPPGTLIYVGDLPADRMKISVIRYDGEHYLEKLEAKTEDMQPDPAKRKNVWVNIEGLNDAAVIEELGETFGIHPLTMEDILDTNQRAKIDEYDGYLFLVLKALRYDPNAEDIIPEQISLVVGDGFLLSFSEREAGLFDSVRERLRGGHSRSRRAGTDYLAYCLIDQVVDRYFVHMEQLGERIELLEESVVSEPKSDALKAIHHLKTDLIDLRRAVWPLREVVNRLLGSDTSLIQDRTRPYLRDVYDHTIHCVDIIETYRDIMSGLLDIYLSSMNNRLNEIMKVLTIIATIFIPLTSLSGWYGMNFKNMPELSWEWGYPMVGLLALSVVAGMLTFFKRRGWLG